jgi:hypothetical protein
MRENTAARRSSYPVMQSALRKVFTTSSFSFIVLLYSLFNFAVVAAELWISAKAPWLLPAWTIQAGPPAPDFKSAITNLSSYLISAQVGVLGVVSIALALVTLIAQRDASSTDIKIYYNESLSFEIVASSIALLVVLCAQLLWPMQFFIHRFGYGTDLQVFKLSLLCVHLAWLILNLTALAHFVSITFRFVQQSERAALRERYTANVVQPQQMTELLRRNLYAAGSQGLIDHMGGNANRRPQAWFGMNFGPPDITETQSYFSQPMFLFDVRMVWVRWVIRRWAARSVAAAEQIAEARRHGIGLGQPLLIFTVHLDSAANGMVRWCRRRGGVPLTPFERLVLRRAFRFRRKNYES